MSKLLKDRLRDRLRDRTQGKSGASMRTGRKEQNSGLWSCFKAPDAGGRSAGSRFRYALRTAGLSGLATGLLIGLWLIGSWVLGTLQTTGIDLPEIEVLRAREEAEYDENGAPVVQGEPFVLLLGPGEEPPLRPLDIAPQIVPDAGALQAVNAEDAAANGVERVIAPERFKKPARRADGPGDDEPLADGPALEVGALGGGKKKAGRLAHVRVSWAF